MKLFARGVALLAIAGLMALAMPARAAQTVQGSLHDMNAVFGAGTIENNEVCLPCHAPHGMPDRTLTRLWNHNMPVNNYAVYKGATLDETSRKCLSCHDGTIAVDSYGGNNGGTHKIGGTSATTGFLVGNNAGDLTHDHPVGVKYDPIYYGTRFVDPATWNTTTYTTVDGAIHNYTGTVIRTPSLITVGADKIVSCYTCHHAHDHSAGFLRMTNDKSQLCLTCHLK